MFNVVNVSVVFCCRLADLGQHVGTQILDVLVVRERGFKRETKLLQILIFVKSTLWKVTVFPSLMFYIFVEDFFQYKALFCFIAVSIVQVSNQ